MTSHDAGDLLMAMHLTQAEQGLERAGTKAV